LFGIRPLDVLRVSVAITLMWASVEKWAYPEWSRPIIEATPGMTLGFSREVFMQAAGVIEFALSFALLLGPLVRRTAAIILFAMFISAVGPFGKIDA
ncbi:DoxX family membrane protein, partial [Acinetobacter baumannii]